MISVALGVVVGCWRKDWKTGLLISYLFFLLTETVLIRKPETIRYELVPFWSWSRPEHHAQILANILMFTPVGLLLGKLGWKVVLWATGISVVIELTQLISRRGLFEFDDIIHNTLGAVIGFGIYGLLKRVKKDDF